MIFLLSQTHGIKLSSDYLNDIKLQRKELQATWEEKLSNLLSLIEKKA